MGRDSLACFTATDSHRAFKSVPAVVGQATPALGAAACLPLQFDEARQAFITVVVVGSGAGRANNGVVLVRCYMSGGQPRRIPPPSISQPTIIQTMPHPPGRPVFAVGYRGTAGDRHLCLGWQQSPTAPFQLVSLSFRRVAVGTDRGGDVISAACTLLDGLASDINACCVLPQGSHAPGCDVAMLSRSGVLSLVQLRSDAGKQATASVSTSVRLDGQQVRKATPQRALIAAE